MSARNRLWGLLVALCLGVASEAPAAAPGRAPTAEVQASVREALRRYATTGDGATLGKALEQAVAQAPRWAEPHYHLARLALHEERWADAVRAQERFLTLAPSGSLSRQVKEGLPRLRALAAAPAGSDEQRALRYELRLAEARQALALGELQEAITAAMSATELMEERWEAPALAAAAFLRMDGNAEAAELLGWALEVAPASEQGGLVSMLQAARRAERTQRHLRAGASAHRARQPAVAAQRYLEAYRFSGDPRHALAAALEFALSDEVAVGAQLLDLVLADATPELSTQVSEVRQKIPELAAPVAPGEAVQAYTRGRVALRGGDAAAAVLAFTQALEKAPGHGPFTAALARAQLAAGGLEAAEATLRQLVEAQPRVAAWRLLQAQALVRLGRGGEAVPLLRSALTLAPGHEELQVRLGLLLAEQKQTREATELLTPALKAAPLGDVHRLEGDLAMARDDAQAAEAAYREALRFDGWNPALHLALSSALFKRQEAEVAREVAAVVPLLQDCCARLEEQWEVAP